MMTSLNQYVNLGIITLALSLSACDSKSASSSKDANLDGKAQATQSPAGKANKASDPTKTADGNTLRLQGSMQVNAGVGELELKSFATVVDANLGEKTAKLLGTTQGQKSLSDAKTSLGGKGANAVTSNDVQDMANAMAGRTVYTSQANHIEIIESYGITLDAKSEMKGGARVTLNLRFSEKDMKLVDGKLEYYPNSESYSESYMKKITAAEVAIDKLERKDDKTFVMLGSFNVSGLKAGVLAKKLKGEILDSVTGKFDFQEVPIRGK